MSEETNWTCPHCSLLQTLTGAQVKAAHADFMGIPATKHGPVRVVVAARGCANPECRELTLSASVWSAEVYSNWAFHSLKEQLSSHRLRPRSAARGWPDYIPLAIREDYEEACLIVDLSPKASATLSRRCMQGMIRDFCGIAEKTLHREIVELEKRVKSGNAPRGVQHEHLDAIDAIRSVGNIGAHMEEDVNVIVEVEEGESKLLIAIIEQLLDEWYVARHKRERLLQSTVQLASSKKTQKQVGAATPVAALPAPTDPQDP